MVRKINYEAKIQNNPFFPPEGKVLFIYTDEQPTRILTLKYH